jgi:hypothetical protein
MPSSETRASPLTFPTEPTSGVQPDLFVAPYTVQVLEIGDPVRPEHNGLPVDYE